MKGKVLRWASLQCSHLLRPMHKGEQGWGECEKAARRRQGGPGVPVPSREGWAMTLWVPPRPTVDKTNVTVPAILLNTVKLFITFSEQENTLFFTKFHVIIHPYTHTEHNNDRCFCFTCHLCLSTSGMGMPARRSWQDAITLRSCKLQPLGSLSFLGWKKSTRWHLFAKLTLLNIFCFSDIPKLCLWRWDTYSCFGKGSLGPHSRILWKLFEVALV